MSTGAYHYRQAEAHLAEAKSWRNSGGREEDHREVTAEALLALAHATLANAAATVDVGAVTRVAHDVHPSTTDVEWNKAIGQPNK